MAASGRAPRHRPRRHRRAVPALRPGRGRRDVARSTRRLALAVADDERVLDLLARVEGPQQQPNLLLGAIRAARRRPPTTRRPRWTGRSTHPDPVLDVLTTRFTQTNEAARCALLLPALAQVARGGPVAVVEVGASAGLCLLYDRYRYRYVDAEGRRARRGRRDARAVVRGVRRACLSRPRCPRSVGARGSTATRSTPPTPTTPGGWSAWSGPSTTSAPPGSRPRSPPPRPTRHGWCAATSPRISPRCSTRSPPGSPRS